MALIYCLVGFLSTEHLLNKRHQSIKSKRFSAQRIDMQKSVTKTPLVAPPQSCPLSVDVFVSTTWPLLSSCLQMSNIWPRLPSWDASFGLCENLNRLCPLRHLRRSAFLPSASSRIGCISIINCVCHPNTVLYLFICSGHHQIHHHQHISIVFITTLCTLSQSGWCCCLLSVPHLKLPIQDTSTVTKCILFKSAAVVMTSVSLLQIGGRIPQWRRVAFHEMWNFRLKAGLNTDQLMANRLKKCPQLFGTQTVHTFDETMFAAMNIGVICASTNLFIEGDFDVVFENNPSLSLWTSNRA